MQTTMNEFKLGQIVYCSDGDNDWRIGHFSGVRGGNVFRVTRSLPDSLLGIGCGYRKCLSVEDYQKLLNTPKDKDLVWAWDDDLFARNVKFYDAKNNKTFHAIYGKRDGACFGHYEVIEDWRNKPDFTWAVTMFESLED